MERENKMYYFIVNTHAKTGNAIQTWEIIRDILQERGVEYTVYETLYSGYATEKVAELTSNTNEHIHLIIVGGDGSINEVVNGIADFSKISVGVIPAGTGNDFARNVGIKGSVSEILDDIMMPKKESILDLGVVHWESLKRSRKFAISSGIGFDALVCKKNGTSRMKSFCNKLGFGKLSYLLLTIRSLFILKTFQADIEVDASNTKVYQKVIFSCAMNLRAEGGGIAMAPKACAKDGLLSFCVAAGIPWFKLPFYLLLLVMAKHENLECYHIHNCCKSHIRTSIPVTLHCDGEYIGETTEIWFESLPQKLSLLNTIKDK